jgi:hypothetical protein
MTISRKKKIKKRFLDSLREVVTLSNNKGNIIYSKFFLSKKDKRHSGRCYPKLFYPQRVLEENYIFVDWYWGDWVDYRDGFRDCSDKNKLRKENGSYWDDMSDIKRWNKKIKRQISIRKSKNYKFTII